MIKYTGKSLSDVIIFMISHLKCRYTKAMDYNELLGYKAGWKCVSNVCGYICIYSIYIYI